MPGVPSRGESTRKCTSSTFEISAAGSDYLHQFVLMQSQFTNLTGTNGSPVNQCGF